MALHEPAMVTEVLFYLAPEPGGVYADCTVGAGGHAHAILERGASRLIGLDRDAEALKLASQRLASWGDQVELIHSDFRELPTILDARGIPEIDGALADLGVSSMQLEGEGRGFSFRRDEPLDMRMDRSGGPTAAHLLQDVTEPALADLIYTYGEERYSRRIARAIVRARDSAPIRTTGQLAEIVRKAIPRRGRARIDPATRSFQALRIWLNGELEGLDTFIRDVAHRLSRGARLVVLSFHSLEDRIVKHTMRALAGPDDGALRLLTRRPVWPSEAEVARNPRARSARLRAVERYA